MSPKENPNRNTPEEIDFYLKGLSQDKREALERLRQLFLEKMPELSQRVSYGIPIFRLDKDFLGISAAKGHCAIHTMSPALAARLKERFKAFKVSGATIQFQPAQPIPEELVILLMDERLAELQSR